MSKLQSLKISVQTSTEKKQRFAQIFSEQASSLMRNVKETIFFHSWDFMHAQFSAALGRRRPEALRKENHL